MDQKCTFGTIKTQMLFPGVMKIMILDANPDSGMGHWFLSCHLKVTLLQLNLKPKLICNKTKLPFVIYTQFPGVSIY